MPVANQPTDAAGKRPPRLSAPALTRRDFLKLGGAAALSGLVVGLLVAEPEPEVVIVGAGIAGLTAAFFLQDRRVLVLATGEEQAQANPVVAELRQALAHGLGGRLRAVSEVLPSTPPGPEDSRLTYRDRLGLEHSLTARAVIFTGEWMHLPTAAAVEAGRLAAEQARRRLPPG